MRQLLTTLLVFAASALADSPSAFAIRGAKIVPVSGPAIASGTVVIRNGLIDAVGENVQVPADAWVLDGKGLTVYPGLIDGLSRWGIPDSPAIPTAGGRAAAAATAPVGPPIRGPEDRPSNTSWVVAADQITTSDRRIETFRNAGFTTAVTYPTRGIFAGQGSVIDLAGEKAGDMVVAGPTGQYLTLRSDAGFGSFPGSLMGVIAYIRQIYVDAGHYKTLKDEYSQNARGMTRPAYDRALEGVLASPRMLLPATRVVEIRRMAAFAAELKQPAVLYGGHEAYRIPEEIKLPVLISLKWPEKSRDADPEETDTLRALENRERAPSTPAALAKAGVKFAFYSDTVDRPADLMKAVKRAIDAGLTREQALRALTLSPAEIYGVADRMGSIEKGKIANLVVTKGDLFEDKTQVQYVFVDGNKFVPAPEEPQTPAGAGARPTTVGEQK